MNQELNALQIAYLNAYNEARTQAGKLNNWINFAGEIDKFNRLKKRAAELLEQVISKATGLNQTIAGTQLFTFQDVSSAAQSAAAVKTAWQNAEAAAANNKLKPGFRDYANALKALNQIAFDYSTAVYVVYYNKMDEISNPTPPIPPTPYPDPEPTPGPITSPAPEQTGINYTLLALLAVGLFVVILIFKRVSK